MILDNILNFFIPMIVEIILGKGIDIKGVKQFQNRIEEEIKKFNRKFDNSDLDCASFQRFLEDKKTYMKISLHFNNKNTDETASDMEFITTISNEAFEYVNKEKERIGHPRITDKAIFQNYFKNLINMIHNLIVNSLELQNKQVANLVIRDASNNKQEILEKVDNNTNIILSEMNSIVERLLSYSSSETISKTNDIKLDKGIITDDKLMQSLTDSDIPFDSETKIIIDSSEGELKGEIIVKHNDFLAKFNNFTEVVEYLYFTQKTVELEPLELRTMIGEKIIQQWKTSEKYDGESVKFDFTSDGEMEIIKESINNNLKGSKSTTDSKISLIIQPQEIDESLVVNLENEDFETILPGIVLRIEERKILDKNHIVVVLSNKGQQGVHVYIKFIFEIINGDIFKSSINVNPMKKNKAIDNLKCLMFMEKTKQSKEANARRIEDNSIVFGTSIQFYEESKNIEENLEIMRSIMFIEKELGIEFDLPDEVDDEDINNIFTLKEIIEFGRVKLNISSLTFTFEEDATLDKFNNNDILMFHFTSNDKYQILNREIDIGEQLIILPKVRVKDIQNSKLTIESLQDSSNVQIYTKYYGDYSVEEIFDKEGIGKFKH